MQKTTQRLLNKTILMGKKPLNIISIAKWLTLTNQKRSNPGEYWAFWKPQYEHIQVSVYVAVHIHNQVFANIPDMNVFDCM